MSRKIDLMLLSDLLGPNVRARVSVSVMIGKAVRWIVLPDWIRNPWP